MRIACFLDTNILVYAALGRGPEERKRAAAANLMGVTEFGVSTQVLQEFYTAVTRKPDRRLSAERALEWIEGLEQQPCAIVDKPLIKTAIELSWRYRISYWDGAILAAAERLGAEIVYTEDLSHGQTYGPVRVVNPFL
jgi:predicted nucleic acid-binding protein